jgi:hypothetical protein
MPGRAKVKDVASQHVAGDLAEREAYVDSADGDVRSEVLLDRMDVRQRRDIVPFRVGDRRRDSDSESTARLSVSARVTARPSVVAT